MILQTENLSHRYGNNWAIKDLNIEIARHGVVGLLGSNGAGKSTTMNIISGALLQTEGNVIVNGITKKKDPIAYKSQIGFLPQQPPLYMDFTVEEFLQYAAQLKQVPTKQLKRATEEAMEKTSLSHMRSRLIKNLSGGFKQRVGIAQSIINNPQVVILDEPTNGLDPNQIIEVRKLIKDIGQTHAVLLSSHVLTEINLMARDIIMIEGGRVVFSDSMDAFNSFLQPKTLLLKMLNMPSVEELLELTGIERVEVVSSNSCRIHFSKDDDLSERVVRISTERNWRLTSISADGSALDEVFKQLSTTPTI